ncbi:dihydrofolate reductase [Desertivirga brevis]|uniref:dihydrofolate reductase n=1 Tax=Desertivirga brevis TaxID=2810310 RepID=UPI001A95B4C6|nr:dihydrofolate reductase [Pedobacter sp. SYSU D00873]
MILSAVVVVDANNGIGKENKLLVHFPADLKRFKKITSGHTVIMGRKTYESMEKALPNRRNIVISRNPGYTLQDAETADSLDQAVKLAEGEEEVFIIGGADIFRQALTILNKVYLTKIDKAFEADTFFPELDNNQWQEVEREDHQPDEKTDFSYSFLTLKKG